MHRISTETPRSLFLELRELRPELAGFLNECKQGHISAQEHAIVHRRLRKILHQGGLEDHPDIADAATALMQTLEGHYEIGVMQQQAMQLREAALHALTFTGGPLSHPSHLSLSLAKTPCLVAADDDRIVREMMAQLFAHQTRLHIASDGTQAYEMIEQHRPDLVILDDFMPGMTGMRLIERLRQSAILGDTRVLMLTGSDRPNNMARAMQAGVVGYITKPFDPSALMQKVREQLLS